MKAQKLRQGKGYNNRVMYCFECSMDITVEEKQVDTNTLDKAILHYTVRDGDRGYFSKEYIPDGMPKKGTKKPDITAIVENNAERKVKWYIYDLKDTVINTKTVLKLCSQWHSGIEHIEEQYLNALDGYSIDSSLGVVTRYWSKDKLQELKDGYMEKINQAGQSGLLTARKSQANRDEYRQKVKAIQYILDGIFIDEEVSGRKKSYDIHYVLMTTADKITYMAEMDIKF